MGKKGGDGCCCWYCCCCCCHWVCVAKHSLPLLLLLRGLLSTTLLLLHPSPLLLLLVLVLVLLGGGRGNAGQIGNICATAAAVGFVCDASATADGVDWRNDAVALLLFRRRHLLDRQSLLPFLAPFLLLLLLLLLFHHARHLDWAERNHQRSLARVPSSGVSCAAAGEKEEGGEVEAGLLL